MTIKEHSEKIKIKEHSKKVSQEQPDWSQNGEIMDVYMVPINLLYYNNDNGRIATLMSMYKEGNNPELDSLSIEEYNDELHRLIKESNTAESFKKTYDDMRNKGQIRPGVILSDGRVVSGNRRFTVLRELYKKTGSDNFFFFKCFIIDDSNINDKKYIKTIERMTQYGVDEKVDYDPISRLVDIYFDLINEDTKLWTLEEYAKKLQIPINKVKLLYYKSLIMIDYLKYINQPNKFFIAKEKKLDGPLQELANKVYGKVDLSEWNEIRVVFYSFMSQKKGDLTRIIRDIIKTYKQDLIAFNNLKKNCLNDIEKNEKMYFENRKNTGEKTEEFLHENILSNDTKKEYYDSTNKVKIAEIQNKEIRKIFDSIEYLIIKTNDVYKIMKEEEKKKFDKKIDELLVFLNSCKPEKTN